MSFAEELAAAALMKSYEDIIAAEAVAALSVDGAKAIAPADDADAVVVGLNSAAVLLSKAKVEEEVLLCEPATPASDAPALGTNG